MFGPKHIDLVAFHILDTELEVHGPTRYHETEGKFNPFESMVADSFVLKHIKEHWTDTKKAQFVEEYGKVQAQRMRTNLDRLGTGRSFLQMPGDYCLAGMRVLGIDLEQIELEALKEED